MESQVPSSPLARFPIRYVHARNASIPAGGSAKLMEMNWKMESFPAKLLVSGASRWGRP